MHEAPGRGDRAGEGRCSDNHRHQGWAGGRDAGLTGGERSELRASGTNEKAVERGERRAKEGPCKPSTLRKREEKETSRGE